MCSCFRGLWRLFCGGGPARRGDKDAENHQEWGRGGVAGADDIEARERLLSNGDADSGRAPVQRPASRKESFALEGAAGADGPAVEDVPLPAPLAARPRSDSKQQQQAPRGEPPSARLSKGGLNAISAAAGDTGRAVTVMRHGHRQDELDATWSRVATRPWDPPLSIKGRSQAREVAAAMRDLNIDIIVTSPFKRCLQTSAEIAAELGTPQGAWLVDWGLSEVCDPRVLMHGRPDCVHMAKRRPVDAWMWGGATMQEAIDMFVQSCVEQLPALSIRPVPRPGSQPPPYPEALEAGLQRYGRTVQQLVWAFPGKNLLVVSHGECVRAVVNMMEPKCEIFEVRHVGYAVLQYNDPATAAEDGHRGWKLASSEGGETGVFWLWEDS
ncbi:hypothetical protein MNEG_1928 [Monoraphidium neglectum]|uniref:Phosphoglycerate mutase n=1 Tax=Monoraphidium neglectum TaxID=145388 RepID=A0A0D2LHS1_9CHLO|nr:hypothetical protein MNEG_1928 [Monoraphidium neglectum]KIZ06034.1 hypothetical protein MNEG_1928 [Monoraphidium neglectum]|eukprot:XP_013905053.1 hypothetical protein MNEG_1928 [Monoraphidium neglectum]